MLKVKDYECSTCGHVVEQFTHKDDVENKMCPNCNHDTLEALLSAPAFKLEGLTGSFPSSYHRWGVDHEQRAARAKAKNFEFKQHQAKEEANVI